MKKSIRRALAPTLILALLLISAVVSAASAEQPVATPPPLRRLLEVSFSARPSAMVVPGEATLSFTITNISEYDAQNVYLTSSDGLHSEPIGQIGAGDSQTFNRPYTVSEKELKAGEISFIVSHDAVNDRSEQVNYTVSAPVEQTVAAPMAEFTRQFSGDCVSPGGTVTITYRVRNTGNVALSQLRVSDPLGDFIGRVETLGVGDTRVFTSKVALAENGTSQPTLSYSVPAEGDKTYENTMDAREIFIAQPQLTATFAADQEIAREGGSVLVTLMLRNLGDADYRHITIRDAEYGGVIASSLELPVGAEPLVVSRSYPVRGRADYQFSVEAVCQTGETVNFETERISLPLAGEAGAEGMALSASTETPDIRRKGNVTFDVYLAAASGTGVRDVTLSEQARGVIRSFEIIPSGEATHYRVTLPVEKSGEFVFFAEWEDARGTHIVRAEPVQVKISSGGVEPERPEDAGSGLFGGAAVAMAGSSVYMYMIGAVCVVLVGLIAALLITSRKERKERNERRAQQKQRLKEEMGKTNRFVPVKRPKPKKDRWHRKKEEQ